MVLKMVADIPTDAGSSQAPGRELVSEHFIKIINATTGINTDAATAFFPRSKNCQTTTLKCVKAILYLIQYDSYL
jgi:hypothetical protein